MERLGGIGEGQIREGRCEEAIHCLCKPNLINIQIHSATCSCILNYMRSNTLTRFFPNWKFSRSCSGRSGGRPVLRVEPKHISM
jgi:hypothetical protein